MAAFDANILPNLVDWAMVHDPSGIPADIAALLAQCNDVLKDIIWQEANEPLRHTCSVQAGLPQGTWRGNNQGVPSSKALAARISFAMGSLASYSYVDRKQARLGGNEKKYRFQQDMQHIQGMSQQIASAIFYSNEAINPQQFTGLAPYYNTVSTSTAASAANVIDGGGTGSSNLSMWLVGWGDGTAHGIFPKGSQAGIVYEDKGDLVPVYDTNGNSFEAYRSYFEWDIGIAIPNWEYIVRMCNIDTTSAGLLGTTPPDLYAMMCEAVNKLPTASRRLSGITEVDAPTDPAPGISPAWYVNRTARTSLDVQAIRDKNVLISSKDYAGAPVMEFRDVYIRVCDSLTNTEARAV